MKLWKTLASVSEAPHISNSSGEISAASGSLMQRRLSLNDVGLKYLSTVARGGDTPAQVEFASAKTSVWWDTENCPVPRGCDGLKIATNIEFALRENNYCGSLTIYAYGDTNQMPSPVQQALSSTGISLNHVPPGKKDGSDKKIIVDVLLWAMENQAPANIMLISGDGDFSYVLNKLRMKNYNIILLRPEKSYSPFLVSVANTVLLWTSIVISEDTKHDQPSKKNKISCDICNVTCTSSVDFNSHISSRKHKNKAGLVAKPNQKDWLQCYPAVSKHVQPSKKSKISCGICNVTCKSLVDFNCHISGRRHQNKLKVQVGASC